MRAVTYVLGYTMAGLLVDNLNKIAWPWVYLGFPPVIGIISAFFMMRARRHLRTYLDTIAQGADWLIGIVIGGLVGAFVGLVQGLLPFYSNPYVLLIWGLYFLLVADMFWLQTMIGKASKLSGAAVSKKLSP